MQEKILSCLLQWWLKHSVVSAYPQFVSANSQLAISCQICKQSLPSHLNKNVALNIINDAAFCCGNVSWKGCSKTSFIVGGGEQKGPGRGRREEKEILLIDFFFLLRPEIHFTSFCKTKWILLFFFPVTIKHYSNNFVCKFWQLSLGWEEGQRASYFIRDCSEGFCNWSVSKILLEDICLLAKEISLLPIILNKKLLQSEGGGSQQGQGLGSKPPKNGVWPVFNSKRVAQTAQWIPLNWLFLWNVDC